MLPVGGIDGQLSDLFPIYSSCVAHAKASYWFCEILLGSQLKSALKAHLNTVHASNKEFESSKENTDFASSFIS